MFTGIVEETGVVREIVPGTQSIRLKVEARVCGKGPQVGDSLAVNGCWWSWSDDTTTTTRNPSVLIVTGSKRMSVRAYHRTRSVKLTRRKVDLTESEDLQSAHLAEALQYRPKLVMRQ